MPRSPTSGKKCLKDPLRLRLRLRLRVRLGLVLGLMESSQRLGMI
jgi:hypothetical protein